MLAAAVKILVLNQQKHPKHRLLLTGRRNALNNYSYMSGISGSKLHLFHINNVLLSILNCKNAGS